MAILNRHRTKKSGQLVAVFDVASASVGGLLFRYRKDSSPEVIVSMRQPANFSEDANFPEIWRVFNDAFHKVAERFKKLSPEKPDVAFCVFTSPWYVSQTKIIKIHKEKPFTVTPELVQGLIKNEATAFTKKWQNFILGEKGAAVMLEQEFLKTILNGYDIRNAFGKKVSSLELPVYLSMGLDMMEEKIKHEILTYIKPRAVYFHTFPFVLFKILQQAVNTNEGMLVVDITGELTDVFLIRNGVLEEANCFVKGENFLIRRIASAFNFDFEEALAVYSQYQRGELELAYAKKVSEVLKLAGQDWAKYLENLLKDMAQDNLLPQNFYFCGSAGSLKEISSQVTNEAFAQFTVLGTPFKVSYLLPDSLKFHFDFPKGFSNNKDIFLLLSAMFADKVL